MPAYVIADIEVTDPEQYETYKKLTPAAIAAFGGKYLVRGGKTITLEGDWSPQRIVILEFESVEQVREWWNSPQMLAVKDMRHQSAKTNFVVVEGVTAQPLP